MIVDLEFDSAPNDPVPPDVDEELAGAEPLPQRSGGAGGECRRPAGHQRVRMEERHGHVADVVRRELVHLGDDPADAGQSALAAEAGLRGPRGTGREQEQAEALLGHAHRRLVGQGSPGHAGQKGRVRRSSPRRRVTGRVVDHQDAVGRERRPEVVAFDELPVGGVGHEQLALRVGQVAGELVAPVGGIAPDDDGPGQGGAPHPEDVLRHVVHEQGDVERPRLPERQQQRGPLGLGPDDLGVGPRAVGERQSDAGVALPVADELVDGLQRFPLESEPTADSTSRSTDRPR